MAVTRPREYTDDALLGALRKARGNITRATELIGCGRTTFTDAIKHRSGFLGRVARLRAELATKGQLDPTVAAGLKGNASRVVRRLDPAGGQPTPLQETARLAGRTFGRIQHTPFEAVARVASLAESVTVENWREVYAAMIVCLADALRRWPASNEVEVEVEDNDEDE